MARQDVPSEELCWARFISGGCAPYGIKSRYFVRRNDFVRSSPKEKEKEEKRHKLSLSTPYLSQEAIGRWPDEARWPSHGQATALGHDVLRPRERSSLFSFPLINLAASSWVMRREPRGDRPRLKMGD